MAKNSMKPQIRFKGFTDAWEQRKLGDLGKAQSGIGFPDKEQGGKTGIPFFKVSDMNNVGNELEMNRSNNYVSPDQIKKNGWSPIEETSVIFAKVGAAIMLNRKRLVRFPFLVDNNTMAYKFSDSWDIEFGRTLFERIDLTSLVQVGALPSYNAGDVENMEVAIPQRAEQYKLGALFKSLDNLITLHQCKEKEAAVRTGVPAKTLNARILANAWEQRKLGDEVQITMGQSPDGTTYRETPSEYILVQGNADLKDGWVCPRIWTTQKTKTAEAGDLIMSVRAPAGSMGKTAYNVVLGRGVAAIKGNEFIFQTLVKMDLDGYWKKLAAGSTFESINSDTVSSAVISLPRQDDEQGRIGEWFHLLDNLITLHQCKERHFLMEDELSFFTFYHVKNTSTWEQRKLGEIFERIVRKNTNNESSLPLTISAQDGLVDQITYFNNRVASRDVSNYYLVLNGEFAYNKSTSDGYPFGAVKRLDLYEKGVLSTLYIVFALSDLSKTDSDYIAVFFDTDRWHRGVAERAAEGARNHGLLNISANDFFDISISLPCNLVEQQKIGIALKRLDNLITLHQRQVEKLKNIKSALLEKMFV